MKKLLVSFIIVFASIASAIPCECYFHVEQQLTGCGPSGTGTMVSSYTYCGSGSYCSPSALRAAYLEACLSLMDDAARC